MTKITRKVTLPSQMDLEIGDSLSTGAMEQINDSIGEVREHVLHLNGSVPDLVRSWETTPASDYNVASFKMLLKQIADRALSRLNPDEAKAYINFMRAWAYAASCSMTFCVSATNWKPATKAFILPCVQTRKSKRLSKHWTTNI